MWYKGKVQDNMVILEEGVHLPNGTDVMVMTEHTEEVEGGEITPEELVQRRLLVAQMKAFGQRLAGRHICLGDALLEGREELDARV